MCVRRRPQQCHHTTRRFVPVVGTFAILSSPRRQSSPECGSPRVCILPSPSTTHPLQSIDMRRAIATAAGLLGVFFFFWSVRLFIVTGFLQHLRPGGGGAYVGAVVFPLLAIAFGWIATRLWRRPD